jgi:hypothetical protein
MSRSYSNDALFSAGYARPFMGLVACPFCREMFELGEAKECPVCGMALVAFEKLPMSRETHDEFGLPRDPAHELLPWSYLGRTRGALTVVGLVGLVLFFLPWIHQTLPTEYDLSGFDLARRLGWVWGAGVGWLVLVPTVFSRRTIAQLRGARVAATFLSAASLTSCAILLLRPPHGTYYRPHYSFDLAFWMTMAASAIAIVLSLRLGGRDPRVEGATHATLDVARGHVGDETLH